MITAFCNHCSLTLGELSTQAAARPAASTYLDDKWAKRTMLNPTLPVQSILMTTSTGDYDRLVADALRNGIVEYDDKHRRNVIAAFDRPTGIRYEHGQRKGPQAAFAVVLSSDLTKRHGFSVSSTRLDGWCIVCGGPLQKW